MQYEIRDVHGIRQLDTRSYVCMLTEPKRSKSPIAHCKLRNQLQINNNILIVLYKFASLLKINTFYYYF